MHAFGNLTSVLEPSLGKVTATYTLSRLLQHFHPSPIIGFATDEENAPPAPALRVGVLTKR